MRIAHICATFPPYHGGMGNACYHNAKELAKRGHEVHVFTAYSSGTNKEEVINGVCIHRLKPLAQFGNAPLLLQLLNRLRGFDLLHLHFPFFGGELSALSACITHTPMVITYHQDVYVKRFYAVIERLMRYTITRATLRFAKKVLFTSLDYSQASYARKLLKGREMQIGELPNGVDIEHFTPGTASDALRKKYQLSKSDRVSLLVATLDVPHFFKGITNSIAAFAELPINFKSIVVGDGTLRPNYEKHAIGLGVKDRVHFAGRVSDSELVDHYRLADVTILPSVTMGEAFGMVLIESMACGTPVIASNLPGVRTVVSDGIDGYLVKPGDVHDLTAKLKQMLELTTEIRRGMGAVGRQKVEEKYTWSKIVDRLEEVYFSVVFGE